MKTMRNLLVMMLAVIGLSNTVNAEVIHIYMSESIDGNTYYRNNIGDTFVLHWGGDPSGANDPGVEAWSWYDSNGVFDESPNETTTLGADFVDAVEYDQSSTETGYSYNIVFQILDPVVYDATFTVIDNGTGSPINGANVSVTGQGSQNTNGSGVCTFTGLADGTYSYTVTATGYDAVNSSFTVSGGNVAVNVSMTASSAVEDVHGIDLNVYPNPCTSYVTIDGVSDVQWELYSITGQMIKRGDGERVGMSDLTAGYYVLNVITVEGTVVKRVLKQ